MKFERLTPARVGLGAGVLLLLGAALTMGSLLLPKGGGGALAAVWVLSLLVLLAGMVLAFRDLRRLEREGEAVAALDREDAMEHAMSLQAPLSDTLAVRRARFIRTIQQDEARAPRDLRLHLRGEALSETATVGALPRFLSSVLLLLAVLGTFAGMKTALPGLVRSIQGAGPAPAAPPGAGAAFVKIGGALAPVADAFGANFLALLGSLCLGVVAFGLAAERRELLGRLERVSEKRLYRHIPVGADASTLERAVVEMRASVTRVAGVGEAIHLLHSSIGTFQQTLVDAIGSLQSSFSDSIQRQSVQIQSQLTKSIGQVATSVLDVSSILAQTAMAYEGLVTGLEERDLGIQAASASLKKSGEQAAREIKGATDALSAAGSRITDALVDAGGRIADAQDRTAAQMEGARASLAESAASLQGSSAEIAAALTAHAEGSRDLLARLDVLAERETAVRGEVAALGETVRGALRDAQSAWAARADASAEAMEVALAQVLTAMDRVAGRTTELHASVQEVRSAVQEEGRAVREGLAEVTSGIASAIREGSLPREDVLGRIGRVGEGAEGIQRQLMEIKELVRSGFEIYRAPSREVAGEVVGTPHAEG